MNSELLAKTGSKTFFKDLLDSTDLDPVYIPELIEELGANYDFTIDDYRFIHEDYIDDIQKEELASDLYILGCFNAWFLSNCSGIDIDIIETLQKSEAFEGLGKLMLPYLDKIQQDYASLDGYGHHFNHYDGDEIELGDWYIFRIN